MRQRKIVNRPLTFEEIHRREKRQTRRENINNMAQRRKKKRMDISFKGEADKLACVRILSLNRKKHKPDKKPTFYEFLTWFSFIGPGISPYDKRQNAPTNYRPRSFNTKRQYTDFMKEFIYPHKIPEALLFAALTCDYRPERERMPVYDVRSIAKKWVRDIVSGDSFYRRNREFFTKAESHFFLTAEIPYTRSESLLELYFYSKCAARKMSEKRCRITAKVFTGKFEHHCVHVVIDRFLDFLARNNERRIEAGELGDICDFLLHTVFEGIDRNEDFSFSGRTMASVIALSNEWHKRIQREQEELHALDREIRGNKSPQFTGKICWKGLPINNFRYQAETDVWTVTQLLSVRQLLNEGSKMKHCVASYSDRCVRGECFIFNVSCLKRDSGETVSCATLEVNAKCCLVQARGKCNTQVSRETKNIITRWAQANRIKVTFS